MSKVQYDAVRAEFPTSVVEKIGYYVYLLIDPTENKVFYVGKGKGNRIFAHLNAALIDPAESEKFNRIRSLQTPGREVEHVLLRHRLTEKEAFEIESALIDFIGIENLTNLVQGHAADDRGKMTVAEAIAKYEAPMASIVEPVILITVNRLYQRGMSADELYNITRGDWVIGSRRDKARYAFAIYNGIIREVYEIGEWSPITTHGKTHKTRDRWRFTGKIADSLRHYVGCSATNYIVMGAQNPIRYVNC